MQRATIDRQPLLEQENNNESEISNEAALSSNNPEPTVAASSPTSWRVFRSFINSLVHTLIGASVFVTLWFALKSTPLTAFQWHVVLNMIGYQFLMAHAFLCLDSYNGWSSLLSITHRRRAHWILQILGSGLAIAGSVIMMRQKTVNFNTIHGKLALAALVFTCISLLNGLATLYAVALRHFMSPVFSRTSHIIVGTTAFTLSSVSLAFGYNKNSFKKWASEEISYTMIAITSAYTLLIIVGPFSRILQKLLNVCKIKIF